MTWGADFRWEELNSKGLQIQEAWRELRLRQAGRSLNESEERPIWNVGAKEVLLVVWDFSFWEGSMSNGSWFFPLFRPSLQQASIEAVRYRSDSQGWVRHEALPSWISSSSLREGRHPETHPFSLGILIVGALWRKSWKANWMWRLEAVREPGPGGVRASRRWPLIPDEREGCCCGWWGWRCCWFLCENQSFYHQLRGGKGKSWKGVVQFCFKGISSCRVFSNSFMMVLLLLRVYDKP